MDIGITLLSHDLPLIPGDPVMMADGRQVLPRRHRAAAEARPNKPMWQQYPLHLGQLNVRRHFDEKPVPAWEEFVPLSKATRWGWRLQ